MGSDAAHRSQAAQTGGRHQATVVRLVLVRDALCFVPEVLPSYLRKWSRINTAAAAASDPETVALLTERSQQTILVHFSHTHTCNR